MWHIRGLNGKSLCGAHLRDFEKELDIKDKRICPKCKDYLFMMLDKKARINEVLKVAIV